MYSEKLGLPMYPYHGNTAEKTPKKNPWYMYFLVDPTTYPKFSRFPNDFTYAIDVSTFMIEK